MRRTILVAAFVPGLVLAGLGSALARGDAKRGGKIFVDSRCASCHLVRGVGGRMGPALGVTPVTPNAMAGAMWTHAAGMWEAFNKAGIPRPLVSEQEAADLYVFIMAAPLAEQKGDPSRGRDVYVAKLCASCHDQYSGARRLEGVAGRVNAFWMMAAMWRHGEGMLSRLVAENKKWQTFTGREMADLIAYLNVRN